MRRNFRLQLWCWIALWTALLCLAASVWFLSKRIEEFEQEQRHRPWDFPYDEKETDR